MHSHSFQDTKFKLLTKVKDFLEQVVEGLSILRYHVGVENKGLITQKTFIRRAFAQFSRYRVEISQVRQQLHVRSRGEVADSTVPQKG